MTKKEKDLLEMARWNLKSYVICRNDNRMADNPQALGACYRMICTLLGKDVFDD